MERDPRGRAMTMVLSRPSDARSFSVLRKTSPRGSPPWECGPAPVGQRRGIRSAPAGMVRRAIPWLLLGAIGLAPVTSGADEQVARGQALYAKQCASCHGSEGRGDGPAAYLLSPKPRGERTV